MASDAPGAGVPPDSLDELEQVPVEYRSTKVRRVPTRTVQRLFLEEFARTGNVVAAADAAGIDRQRHYDWLKSDPSYAQRFAAADGSIGDLAEGEAHRRGIRGVEEPVFGKLPGSNAGTGIVGRRRVYSDRLLELVLRARKPERYRERVEHTGPAVQVQVQLVQTALAQVPEDALRVLVAALAPQGAEAPALPAPLVRAPEPAPLVRVDTMPAEPVEPAPPEPRRGPGRPPGARDKRRRKRRKDTPGARKAREARAARKDAAAPKDAQAEPAPKDGAAPTEPKG